MKYMAKGMALVCSQWTQAFSRQRKAARFLPYIRLISPFNLFTSSLIQFSITFLSILFPAHGFCVYVEHFLIESIGHHAISWNIKMNGTVHWHPIA